MAVATRVRLSPRERWEESWLVDAARNLRPQRVPLFVGDTVGNLVVTDLEPANGSVPDDGTLFDIEPLPINHPKEAAYAVTLLLDASESMEMAWNEDLTRFEAARYAIETLMRQAPPLVHRMSIVAYAKHARSIGGFDVPARLPRDSARNIRPQGPAEAGRAVDAVLAMLARKLTPKERGVILLLTDGAGDAVSLEAAAARAERLGVAMHALVLAPEIDPVLAAQCRHTRGTVAKATLPPSLGTIIESLGREARAPVAWNEPRMPRAQSQALDAIISQRTEPTLAERIGIKERSH